MNERKSEFKWDRFRYGLIAGILLTHVAWIVALIIGMQNGAIK